MRKKIIPIVLLLLLLLTACTVEKEVGNNEVNLSETQNINLYYPNIDDEKYYYKTVEIEVSDEANIVDTIVEAYKVNTIKGTEPVLSENTRINKIDLDENGVLNIDFNKEFITDMNAGSSYEELILHSVANTFGEYYKSDKLAITVAGSPYESGHILLEEGDYIETDYTNSVNVDENIC